MAYLTKGRSKREKILLYLFAWWGREPSVKLCGFTFSYFYLFVTSDFEFSGDARGGEGVFDQYLGIGLSPPPPTCLGRKNPKIHTLFRTTPSNLLPCLGKRTKLDCERSLIFF